MKILYGVQGTGNGHLTRARAMARAFGETSLEVDYLFSGRDANGYFDMQCFGDYRTRKGLTFVYRDGRLDLLRTPFKNDYPRFLRDVLSLDLSQYDLLISDFEPVVAWAGRLRGKRVLSVGHQPAFDHAVPVAGRDWRTVLVMRLFAPGTVRIGMHWDSFAAPILPPLVDIDGVACESRPDKVLVYLPFESQSVVHDLLRRVPGYDFFVYAPGSPRSDEGRLHLRPTSLAGFRRDLNDAHAVICNAGFELASECLALGKRLLVKPMTGQMEQASNALALRQLGYGQVLEELDVAIVRRWLALPRAAPRIAFPDVAAAIVGWIQAGDYRERSLLALSTALWRDVVVSRSGGDTMTQS